MVIRKIINRNAIRILFQPIHDIKTERIIGYEALARGPEGEGANRLFALAKEAGLKDELEMTCFRKAVSEFQLKLNSNGSSIFLNFHPETLAKNCDHIIKALDGLYEKTVLEITESSSEIRYITNILNHLRKKGIRIALDDIGSGDRSLSNICELQADYLKIDRGIIQGLTKVKSGDAEYYRSLLRFLVDFSERKEAQIIAEGVETKNQYFETLMSGISLVQGFYFSKPRPAEYWVKREQKKNAMTMIF